MSSLASPRSRFVDLFAGIGGFHAALSALGGHCVYAVEKDPDAAAIYERNWKMSAHGDIVDDTVGTMKVPPHDVLAAGFPCQPFSKSGFQRGMDEARGTLFWNICEILRVRRPSVVLLENVRNIAGPRHFNEWAVIIRSLRDLGYRVSSKPIVFSPHLLPPSVADVLRFASGCSSWGPTLARRQHRSMLSPPSRTRLSTTGPRLCGPFMRTFRCSPTSRSPSGSA